MKTTHSIQNRPGFVSTARLSILLAVIVLSLAACVESADQRNSTTDGESEQMRQLLIAQTSFNPETSQRLLRADELDGLTAYQLRIMRNEIYARHGYVFEDAEVKNYFEKQQWYEPDVKFTPEMLSEIEKQNVALIREYEDGKRDRGTSDLDAGTPEDRRAIVTGWGARYAQQIGHTLIETDYDLYDVDGDGDRDAVSLYSTGPVGGNAYYSTLAVFENVEGVLAFAASEDAGGIGDWVAASVERVTDGKIVVSTAIWFDGDAQCCPSGHGTVMYTYEKGRLVQAR